MFNRDRWTEIFETIGKNKLRTFLSGFTVSLGIFIFIILFGLGNGLKNTFQEFFLDDASNAIFLYPGKTSKPYKGFKANRRIEFRNDDLRDIKENFSIFNLKLNKFICENSSIFKHGKSYNDDSQTHSLSYNYYQIEQDVALNVDSMVKSSFFNKEFIEVDLNKVGSDAKINILNLGKEEQHVDNNILINHKAEHCTSFQHVRNVLDNKSTAVFNGKVIVAEGAQQTDSNQSNKNLLLSLESNAFSNPQLEIYADDVSCGHGSTTGALDENSIFYLRARGIDYSSAQKILIKAFAKEVIDDFSLSSLQDISEIALDSWIDG